MTKPFALTLILAALPTIVQAQTFKSSAGDLKVETVVGGLVNPWALAFLPDGRMLVTERPGRMRIATPDGKLSAPLGGVPKVMASGQGGLHDVVLDRNFAQNRTIYFCFAEPDQGGGRTTLARATLGEARLDDVKLIFRQDGPLSSGNHFGCRIAQTADNNLFLTLGDHFTQREEAKNLRNHIGKVVRIAPDGSAPSAATPSRRTGASVTATRRAPRSIRRAASSGCTSTARAAATRSTFRSPERTTAGR
jgi:glucose/arabinose dehydrogenase